MKWILEVATIVLLLVFLGILAKAERLRVIVPRECMQGAQYYKGECNVEGTLLHCKDIWIEFTCEHYAVQK